MAKIVSILILVVVVITVQGQAPEYAEVIKAAKAGNWDQVQELLNSNLGKQAGWKPPLFDSLRDLKPENGGHVYGEAEYAYHSASNVNGKTTEHNAGHKIINEDGRVKEFDFTPSTSHAPLLQSLVSSLGQKAADFAASDYHYQYGGSVAGKPNFAAQKLSNNVQQDYYPRNSAVVPIPSLTFTNVRDLKPPQGGHVYGEAQYAYHTATNINGQKTEDAGGHKIINNDGKVKEFDFTPKPKFGPVSYF